MTKPILLAIVFLSIPINGRAEETTLVLENFDGNTNLSKRWTASGEIIIQRRDAPNDLDQPGVAGKLAVCDAKANSKFLVNRAFPRPPYEEFDTIRFQIRAENASPEEPLAFEFQVFSRERPAMLWRKFSADTNQWQAIELPMRFFRFSNGANLDWSEVSRFGIHFRAPSKIQLDSVELAAHGEASSPYLSVDDLGALAFGDRATFFRAGHFVVITNDRRVDGQAALGEFETLLKRVYADFPKLPKPLRPIPTLIFANQEAYQRFWPKFGQKYASVVPPVRSNGYSLLGVAGSYYSDEYGPVRPVLIHEACHALLGPVTGLANTREWFHEGLANYYQLSWTKQDIHALNKTQIEFGRHRPLRELLDGRPIRMRDYAQATLFTKWLMVDPERKTRFFAAIQDMRLRSSTALEPICKKHFGRSIDELELEWLRWAKRQSKP